MYIMQLNKVSVDDINVKGKKVLVRCDFNVPLKDAHPLFVAFIKASVESFEEKEKAKK